MVQMSSGPWSNVAMPSSPGAFLKEQGMAPLENEPLRRHNTWRIGGPADFLVEPSSWEQVVRVLQYASATGIAAVVIGKGSNLLFDDRGLRGVVIKIGRKLSRLTIAGTIVQAQSGISASRLARAAGLAGLGGLEHIVGIPGTLGGLVFMNGGSLRQAIGDVIVQVRTMDRQGNTRTLHRQECGFAYRHSRFQEEACIITEATLALVPGRRDALAAEMREILRERRRKFPMTLPNCGSVFKSDPQTCASLGPTGKIIEGLGLKGTRVGDAAVSERHANFIVNRANAQAKDVLALIELVRERVLRQTGLTLQCEVQFVEPTGVIRAP
jgi:UDP-N-acetylmuramate dehydrogenase